MMGNGIPSSQSKMPFPTASSFRFGAGSTRGVQRAMEGGVPAASIVANRRAI